MQRHENNHRRRPLHKICTRYFLGMPHVLCASSSSFFRGSKDMKIIGERGGFMIAFSCTQVLYISTYRDRNQPPHVHLLIVKATSCLNLSTLSRAFLTHKYPFWSYSIFTTDSPFLSLSLSLSLARTPQHAT